MMPMLAIHKPVVMTAAMRPATSTQADGPAHLRQALVLAADPRARGLLFAFAGQAWRAADVRKVDPFALQAFAAGGAQPLARWEKSPGRAGGGPDAAGHWRWLDAGTGDTGDTGDPKDQDPPLQPQRRASPSWRIELPRDTNQWPRVDIISSHAGCDGRIVQALLDAGAQGLVISATGNGSVHAAIDAALRDAVGRGSLRPEQVRVASRCIMGPVVGVPVHGWALAPTRTPAQARVELMLELMASHR